VDRFLRPRSVHCSGEMVWTVHWHAARVSVILRMHYSFLYLGSACQKGGNVGGGLVVSSSWRMHKSCLQPVFIILTRYPCA